MEVDFGVGSDSGVRAEVEADVITEVVSSVVADMVAHKVLKFWQEVPSCARLCIAR